MTNYYSSFLFLTLHICYKGYILSWWTFTVLCFCVSVAGKEGQSSQILYTKRAAPLSGLAPASVSSTSSASSSTLPQGSPESRLASSRPAPFPSSPSQSQAAVRAREFAADLFRRAQGGGGREIEGQGERGTAASDGKEAVHNSSDREICAETQKDTLDCKERWEEEERRTNLPQVSASVGGYDLPLSLEQIMSPTSSSSSPLSPPTPTSSSSQEMGSSEPGYVNYTCLHYRLQQPGAAEQNAGGAGGERGRHKLWLGNEVQSLE